MRNQLHIGNETRVPTRVYPGFLGIFKPANPGLYVVENPGLAGLIFLAFLQFLNHLYLLKFLDFLDRTR